MFDILSFLHRTFNPKEKVQIVYYTHQGCDLSPFVINYVKSSGGLTGATLPIQVTRTVAIIYIYFYIVFTFSSHLQKLQ